MGDKSGALCLFLTCFVLTFFAAFWWNNFRLALLLSILQLLSFLWLVSLHGFNWNTHNPGFKLCFNIGVGGTFLGVGMLLLPLIGHSLFSVFYTLGTVCKLGSLLFLIDILQHWEKIFDKIKAHVNTIMNIVLTYVKSVFEWLKSDVVDGALAPAWTHIGEMLDWLNSDVGGIALGLGALLFPTIGLGLFLGSVLVILASLGNLLGNPGNLGNLLNDLGKSMSPPPSQNRPSNEHVQTDRKERNKHQKTDDKVKRDDIRKQLADKLLRWGMKFCCFMTLFAVLWNWGLALFFWLLKCLLWVICYILHHCLAHVLRFILCFIIGAGCMIMGVHFLPGMILFSVFYILGNGCILGSTLFLVGLSEQVEKMFDKTRAVAASVMLGCLVLTLFAAFWWKSFVLALILCSLQILSSLWYCLSYIPCARKGYETIMGFIMK